MENGNGQLQLGSISQQTSMGVGSKIERYRLEAWKMVYTQFLFLAKFLVIRKDWGQRAADFGWSILV